jgi:hypothetical protein
MRASCALRVARHAKRLQSHQFHLQLIVPAGLIALGVRRSDVDVRARRRQA